jgi:next-to-BRCA1 protein 1
MNQIVYGNGLLTIHDGIFCNNCQLPVIGKRYKCIFCKDYDLCEICEKSGVHEEHSLIRFAKKYLPSYEETIEQIIYNANFCNYCNDPVIGVGFKCSQCYDFDICNKCRKKGRHKYHKLEAFYSTLKKDLIYLHKDIFCNMCSKPVVGIRYKCSVCNDFNLCIRCESLKMHKHPFIKITKKSK